MKPGGVCLNWGCIPSKALLNSAETMESIRGAGKEHGIEVGEVKLDFKRVIARSREAADKLSKGVRFLLRKNKVDLYRGRREYHRAAIASRSPPAAGKPAPPAEAIEAERILVATGSGERLFAGMKIGDGVMTSREALHARPSARNRSSIIGAGAMGLEFGVFLPGLRRQGDDGRAGEADAARIRRRDRRGVAQRLRQARGHGDAGARLQIDGAQGRADGRSRWTPPAPRKPSRPRPCWLRSGAIR